MHGTFDTQFNFPVHEASPRRMGDRWSTVTACLAGARSCAATFAHRGALWRGVTAILVESGEPAPASAVMR